MLAQLNLGEIQKNAIPEFKFKGNSGSLGGIISALVPYVFTIAGLLLLLYLIIGGFGLLTSGGDPKKMQGAKGQITNALVGFLIIFVSYWLVQIIGSILGLEIIGKIFETNP